MFIQTHQLDDPARMRFTPGEPVLPAGQGEIAEEEAAARSPLVRRLLRIDGVEAVTLGLDDLVIRRAEEAQWYLLKPSVLGAIMEHYGSGDPVVADPVVVRVLDLLADRIRPAIEAYGGEVLFRKFDGGTLTLELIGGGGPAKQNMMTNIVTHHVPEVNAVTWISDAPQVEIPEGLFERAVGGPKGPEAEAVQSLLDEKVNPAVAAHGGRITLIDVADHVAYVRMEGGCQGCSASAVTLQQGVKNAIMTDIPSIQGVVDVTDHAAGMNPFFE